MIKRTRVHHEPQMKFRPTQEEFQRMHIKYNEMLHHSKQHADDPTGILSRLYHDIVEKYVNLRNEFRFLTQEHNALKKLLINYQLTEVERARRWEEAEGQGEPADDERW